MASPKKSVYDKYKTASIGAEVIKLDAQLIAMEPAVLPVLKSLKAQGYTSLIVGGAVRDAYMGIEPKDIDIEVYQISYSMLSGILEQYGKVNLVGKNFGVIKFKPKGAEMEYDFSVPRKENKIGIGHKEFEVTFDTSMTIKDAALRRDFTFNALAYDPIQNTVYDYFGGIGDISLGIIRHTSDKFSEDPLRILRAMQFQARFDFAIAPETILEIRQMLKTTEFSTLPKERIFEEWKKWAEKGIRHDLIFQFLRDTTLIDSYPELKLLKETPQDKIYHPEGDVEIHTMLCIKRMDEIIKAENIQGKEKLILVMAILFHDIAKPQTTEEQFKNERMTITSHGHEEMGGKMVKEILPRMGFYDEYVEPISNLVANHLAGVTISFITAESGKVKAVKKLSKRLFPATIKELLYVMDADSNGRGFPEFKVPTGSEDLARIAKDVNVNEKPYEYILKGRHLIELGLKPSKQFGEILDKANEAQENGEFSTVDEGREWLLTYVRGQETRESDFKLKTGGILRSEKRRIHDEWSKLVNMSSSELKKFYNSDEGKQAGLSPKEARALGIHNGRESARWILKMKATPFANWTDTMWDWCKRQVAFISRMKNANGELYDDEGKKTRKHTALLIWGHNPEKKYESGGETDELLAPNGKKSNLNSEQYRLVRTPEFINWFGDWINTPEKASKVVDENGEPLVVWHGTSGFFSECNKGKEGGIFFTPSKKIAEGYAAYTKNGRVLKLANSHQVVMPVFLNLRNPYTKNFYYKPVSRIQTAIKQADKNDSDGVIILNGQDFADYSGMYEQYVVFNSEQIKLADGSNTTFDNTTADIRYENGGILPKITFDNFYENTSANFELVSGPTNWPVKNPTYISDHGSKYWHIGNYVYRLSDHWGEFDGGCTWLIEGYPYNAVEPIMGRANLSEFKHKQVMAKGGNVGGTYQSKVDANLVHMGTEAADWKAVPIIGFQEVDIDHGKTRSMPIFDFSVMKGFSSPDTLYPATSGGFKDAMTNCELCGHNIKNVYHIYDAKHKYKLHVGSECITHFQDGKSGKDKERDAKIMIALMLDKDLEALGGIVRQDLSRVRTERTFHGGTKNVREWHTLNIGYYTEGKSRGEYEIKVGEAVSKIDFDILKPKRFEYTKTINGKDIYDSIKPFSYDYEMERVSDGEGTKESVDKKLLSWFSRNEVMQVAVIKAAVGLLQAFEYPVDFSSDYLNFEEINTMNTQS